MSAAKSDARMHYFALLSRDEQEQAIRRMAASGLSDHVISAATMLSVEQIKKILGERANP